MHYLQEGLVPLFLHRPYVESYSKRTRKALFWKWQRQVSYWFYSGKLTAYVERWQEPACELLRVTRVMADTWRVRISNQVRQRRQGLPDNDSHGHLRKRQKVMNNSKAVEMDDIIETTGVKYELDKEQSRAYHIFVDHLKAVEFSEFQADTENRCLYVGGGAGSGKSRIIHAIEEVFQRLGKPEKLLVSATTGVAAQLIKGSTIDALCKFGKKGGVQNIRGDNEDTIIDIANYWLSCEFLVVDEISMGGCHKLRRISKALKRFKGNSLPFGGLYVLFIGDFQQLKPVKDRPLFVEPLLRQKSGKSIKKKVEDEYRRARDGYMLWKDVTERTVMLTGQYRASDKFVSSFLDRVARGQMTFEDKESLRKRVFGHPEGPDINMKDWRDAILITPRNALRQAWNNNAALRHVEDTGHQIFISPSKDEGINCKRSDMVWTVDSRTEFLATWNVLCIEGPALVTANAAVELGVANGTEVIVKAVIPDPEDEEGWNNIENPIVKLGCPPICVFVELLNGNGDIEEYYPGKRGWFPLLPIKEEIVTPPEFHAHERTFVRTQIPSTPGFSMSDYRVQGRGISRKFILDLRRPPTGRLDLQNIYVMLSRMVNWEDLAILRPYQDDIFDIPVNTKYVDYEKYLKERDRETRNWYESLIVTR
jgi:PIF1-like helicase